MHAASVLRDDTGKHHISHVRLAAEGTCTGGISVDTPRLTAEKKMTWGCAAPADHLQL